MFNCVSAVLCPVLYFHFFLPFLSCCTVRYCTVLVQCSTLELLVLELSVYKCVYVFFFFLSRFFLFIQVPCIVAKQTSKDIRVFSEDIEPE